MELGVPLSKFINKPPKEALQDHNLFPENGLVPAYYHWVGDPIPLDHLKYFITNNLDKLQVSHAEKLITAYKAYVTTLCGKSISTSNEYSLDLAECRLNLLKKWEHFRDLLESVHTLGFSYSLHY